MRMNHTTPQTSSNSQAHFFFPGDVPHDSAGLPGMQQQHDGM